MNILLALASLSGNTREVARAVATRCEAAGHRVDWIETDIQTLGEALPESQRGKHDLYLLGSWTDNAGRTPAEMKRFIAELVEAVGKPAQVAVFGTGETQWGAEYYCGAVHRIATFFASPFPRLLIEQMPHGERDAQAIAAWTDTVLASSTQHKDNPQMQTITATSPDDYAAALAAHPRLLVDYYKDNCPGCKMLDMSLQKFAASDAADGVALLKVKMEVIGEDFFRDLGLRQTPTLAMFKDGAEVVRLPGFQTPAQVETAVRGAL